MWHQPFHSDDFLEIDTSRTSLFGQHHGQMEIAKAHHHGYDLKGPKENVIHARKISISYTKLKCTF